MRLGRDPQYYKGMTGLNALESLYSLGISDVLYSYKGAEPIVFICSTEI